MRVTTINARTDRGGKHNDRNFDICKSSHICASRTNDNKYYTYNGDMESTFEQLEKQFYEENFMSHIEKQNQKNKEAGHSERNRTLDQYYRHNYSRPEDRILQIGNIKEHASAEELWDCALEYAIKFNDQFGDYCKILDMALHVDEATPHVHIRRVWLAEDKNGDAYVSQTKALHKMGFQNQNTSKWTNEKTEFTRLDRRLFYEICRERGLKVEIDNPVRRKHLSIPEYKKAMDELGEMERTIEQKKTELKSIEEEKEKQLEKLDELAERMEQLILSNPKTVEKYYMELKLAREKETRERYRIISDIYRKEIERLYSHVMTAKFIKEEGLQAKYTAYCKRKELRKIKEDVR